MRKSQKQEVLDFINSLHQAHKEIQVALHQKKYDMLQNMLSECQEFSVTLGENIERLEGEGCITVSYLEEYCETLFRVYEEIRNRKFSENKIFKILNRKLLKVENSVKNDISIRKEIVFFPYKVSMWDSLESVYWAAKEDAECDVYCVPIPYYDLNPDHSFGKMHYEGDEYPDDIEIVNWQKYNFVERRPDVIYIHNPYDEYNFVTSVHPWFYSSNLKKYTDTLVYIPYYSTSGSMSEGQSLCPAYIYADYIVIQAPRLRAYFDKNIPDRKFLPFGSPKFDRVIRKCQNPPEPPEEWKTKMVGRRVYFYNTSISGMLADTEAFLKKMNYVFQCFEGREDVCLLWRPHPLLDVTFNSMRPQYRQIYEALKKQFVKKDLGILDMTSDITDTIALSDAYIGDAGTSVTSLFGVVGKPIFIMNNYIHTLPQDNDWRGEKISLTFDLWGDDRYQVTANNQLWFSQNNDYHYKFYMNLDCEYSSSYYTRAVEIGDNVYVLPYNAQNILIIRDKKIKKIEFERHMITAGAFYGCIYNEKYIFLFPNEYPQVIRFEVETENIQYIDGIKQFYLREIDGKRLIGGNCMYGNEIIFGSPVNNEFLFMDIDTLKVRFLKIDSVHSGGTLRIIHDPYGKGLWIVPLKGMVITFWNPETGETREYEDLPKGFKSVRWIDETECDEQPFGMIAFSKESGKENIVVSPIWGNMYLTIDRETGKMEPWAPPIDMTSRGNNGYFSASCAGGFVLSYQQSGKSKCRLWHVPDRKLYEVNIDTKDCREIEIEFDYDDLRAHETGFAEESEGKQYCLKENAFNSLKDFLDDRITGKGFNKERQIDSYAKINANPSGTCGEKVHAFLKKEN